MTDPLAALLATLAQHYTIEREAGVGGMATVYLARDLKHDRHVALKVLKPELSALLGVERFLSEIRVTAHLQHPHILPLFDSGQAGGLIYYVMPHVEGESLRQRLEREKQLPLETAIEITRAVASALDYAHRHGVIHRDIKPENILFQDGQAVVADFGIALALTAAGGSRLTETGLSLGTPQYMSPEQATGDRALDARSGCGYRTLGTCRARERRGGVGVVAAGAATPGGSRGAVLPLLRERVSAHGLPRLADRPRAGRVAHRLRGH